MKEHTPQNSQMKRLFCVLILLLAVLIDIKAQIKPNHDTLPGATTIAINPQPYMQGAVVNYIRTWQPVKPLTLDAEVISDVRQVNEVQKSTQYFDGLGRLIQLVKKGINPTGQDIVSPKIYDAEGREVYSYLPYASGGDGSFKPNSFADQNSFYRNSYPLDQPTLSGERVFYSQTNFETSPLSRVVKTLAPGNSWAGNNRGISTSYEINDADEVKKWEIGFSEGTVPTVSGDYAAGELHRMVVADEHDKRVVEYKNKDGNVVLKKVEISHSGIAAVNSHSGWLCTYYIYDDLGNLRFVIQPKGVELLATASWAFDGANWSASNIAKELCFSYEYDERNRMVLKRVPGAAEVDMVYDGRDRLVLMRDGNLRTAGKWLVTQYDHLNRPVRTYLWDNAGGRLDHKTAAGSSTAYPNLSGGADLLSATYFDDYSWVATEGGGLSSNFSSTETASGFLPASDVTAPYARTVTTSSAVRGMVTGTQIKVLGTSTYLYTVNFYDDRGRLIQVQSKNMTGGIDITTTQYSFDGKVLVTKQNHNTTGMIPGNVVTVTKNQYDHAGRLLSVIKQVNGGDEVTIAENTYDALGQLKIKKLGRQKPGGVYSSAPIETLTYDYNIRSWITGINKDYALNPASENRYFGEQLHYDYGFDASQYNGNISGIIWSSANDQQSRAYGYTYDAAARLLKADFTENNGGSWNTGLGKDYTVIMGDGSTPSEAYDANGNIKKMTQYAGPGTAIDILAYDYGFAINGNKLKAVKDDGNNSNSSLGDFKEITYNQSQDYDYDANGNITVDNNKGISSITYNNLNLPVSINITGKGTINYTYDATGNKLQKIVTDATNGNNVTATTYIGEFQYENGDLKQFGHEEGRVRRKPDGSYAYDYYIKDHLGSVRVTLTEEESVQVYRMATMELDSAQQEETYYINVAETRSAKPTAYPDRDSANKYVAKLDGKQKKAGPAILLKVSAGDRINIRAQSWYKLNSKKAQPGKKTLAQQAASLAGTAAGGGVIHNARGAQVAAGTALVPALMSFLNTRDGNSFQKSLKPKAYLNWVLLDEDLKPFKEDTSIGLLKKTEYTGFQQVGEEEELKQHIKENWNIAKSGYAYIFTSNESEGADVVFEDLGITSVQGPLLEVNHTYPFGLTIAEISSKAPGQVENKRRYNSIEFNNDLDINAYDAFYRNLDPQTGRWWQIDPKIESMEAWSPYASNYNNPVRNSDMMGDEPGPGPKSTAHFREATEYEYQSRPIHAFIMDAGFFAAEFFGLTTVDNAISTIQDENATIGDKVMSVYVAALSTTGLVGEHFVEAPHPSSPKSKLNLEKSLASEELMASPGDVIAGGTHQTPLRKAGDLANEYGGQPSDWVKKTSKDYIAKDNTRIAVHWEENLQTGQRVNQKTKMEQVPIPRPPQQASFYYINPFSPNP